MITGPKNNKKPGSENRFACFLQKTCLLFMGLTIINTLSHGQNKDCLFKDSLFHLNFSTNTQSQDFSFVWLKT